MHGSLSTIFFHYLKNESFSDGSAHPQSPQQYAQHTPIGITTLFLLLSISFSSFIMYIICDVSQSLTILFRNFFFLSFHQYLFQKKLFPVFHEPVLMEIIFFLIHCHPLFSLHNKYLNKINNYFYMYDYV